MPPSCRHDPSRSASRCGWPGCRRRCSDPAGPPRRSVHQRGALFNQSSIARQHGAPYGECMVKEASADVAASDGMNAIRPVMAARWMSLSEWTPSDAEIGVLIPCEHAALTAVHRVDGTRERRAFVRAPMVALIPL